MSKPLSATAPSDVRVDAEDLVAQRAAVRGLSLPGRRPAGSLLAGDHRTRLRGRGMDYLESRHYQAGDDIRNMDWRVTARAGRPHTKVYQAERERPVVVLVDFHPSMFFATRGCFKSVAAARAAALIGWTALASGDRIGALLFNGSHHELVPRGGRRGVSRLIRTLVETGTPPSPDDGASRLAVSPLSEALVRLRRVARPGSLVYLLSDFHAADPESAPHLLRLSQHCELVAVQVMDPLELAPPPPGRYGVSDGHRDAVLDTRHPAGRGAYEAFLVRHHRRVCSLTREQGIPLLPLRTDREIWPQLQFAARQAAPRLVGPSLEAAA